MNLLDALIAGKLAGSGGATPAGVASAIGNMSAQQARDTLEALGIYPVNVDTSDSPYTADKTYAEVAAAIAAGKAVVFLGTIESHSFQAPAVTRYSSSDIQAIGMIYSQSKKMWVNISYSSSALTVSRSTVAVSITHAAVTGATPTISAADNTIYECGELTSLTVSQFPATGSWSIVFTSGSTPTVTSFPATILGLDSFAAEANTMYEINVFDSRAVATGWAVSAGE